MRGMSQGKERVKRMKSRSIVISAIVMIPIVIIISVLSAGYSGKRGGRMYFVLGGKVRLRNEIEIPLSDIDNLKVSYTSDNLEVYPIEGDTVIIKEYLISDKKDALADVEINDRTAVITGGRAAVITIFGFFTGTERIELYLPKEGIADLSLRTTSGNITTKDGFSVEAENLELTAGSGNIKWFDSAAEKMNIQAGSGNIGLTGFGGNVSAQAGSGNITAERLSGTMVMETGSGNITVRELSGEGNVTAGSGNVKVEVSQATGDIEAKTGSGNIHMTLPKELSFQIEIQTGSGNINTSFDDILSYNKKGNQAGGNIGGNPSCLIRAEANSGNVRITAE